MGLSLYIGARVERTSPLCADAAASTSQTTGAAEERRSTAAAKPAEETSMSADEARTLALHCTEALPLLHTSITCVSKSVRCVCTIVSAREGRRAGRLRRAARVLLASAGTASEGRVQRDAHFVRTRRTQSAARSLEVSDRRTGQPRRMIQYM